MFLFKGNYFREVGVGRCAARNKRMQIALGQEDQGRLPGRGKLELSRTELSTRQTEPRDASGGCMGPQGAERSQYGWRGQALMPALMSEDGGQGFA